MFFDGQLVATLQLREVALSKVKAAEFAKEDVEKERNLLTEQKMKLEKEIEDQKKLVDQQRRRVEEIAREKEFVNKAKTQVTTNYLVLVQN